MKIILKSDVKNLGLAGELVKVKPGYARNYLFPRGLAWFAASVSQKEALHKKQLSQIKAKKAQKLRDETAQKLNGKKIVLTKEASAKGRLFGAVSSNDIALALEEQGFSVDKKFIRLEKPLKQSGEHKFDVLFGKTSAQIELTIQGSSSKKAPATNKEEEETPKASKD